ncbi:hypothetical protein ACOQFV_07650 [Nocardiopsis changdeensis]|uniref:hypothetical protein n=1 Tax=Nocardiopsis changdeensis TaxID=2831969 RepID=UPI003B9C0826
MTPTRTRRWKRPLAGITAAVLGGVIAAWAAGYEEERTPMLIAATDLVPGEVLTSSHVRIVHALGVEGLDLATTESALGAPVALPVPEGTVLTSPMFTDTASWPAPGNTVVSMQTTPGMLPASAGPGAPLLLMSAETDPVPARLHGSGEEGETSGSRVIELIVPEDRAADAVHALEGSTARLVLTPEP